MGYAKEKQKVERKKKKIKRIIALILVVLVAILLVFEHYYPAETWKYYFKLPNVGKRAAGETRIHFVDVGQGDCTIIELPDGKTMMIDGGDDSEATEKNVLRYLNALKVNTIDYMVLTHADADHCGGLVSVFEYKTVKEVFLPIADPMSDNDYARFYTAMLKEGCSYGFAYSTDEFTEGVKERNYLSNFTGAYPYTLSFIYPQRADVDNGLGNITDEQNDRSVTVWLDYMGTSALFAGDLSAEKEEFLCAADKNGKWFEQYGVALSSTEILKVSHHGSKYSTSSSFIEYLNLQTAVISCGVNNAYGHPSTDTILRLVSAKAEIYRTDQQGSIILTLKQDGTYTKRALGK